jgi:hypothetical protein
MVEKRTDYSPFVEEMGEAEERRERGNGVPSSPARTSSGSTR